MSNISKRKREDAKSKGLGNHDEFLKRVTRTLYYGKLPSLPCLSLPVTELTASIFSQAQKGRSLKRLHIDEAAEITRNSCVSPCSLILALLYLERLKTCNSEYIAKTAPSELFLVSLMVSNKFLQDDGEDDEVFCDEWAASGDIGIEALKQLEWSFLEAIDWRLYVSDEVFINGLSWLECQVALQQSHLRGWFTYTDLAVTLGHVHIKEFIGSLATVCIALSVSYVASITTLVASSLIVCNTWIPAINERLTLIPFSSPCNVSFHTKNTTFGYEENALHMEEDIDESLTEILIKTTNDSELEFNVNSFKCCNSWLKYINHQTRHPVVNTDILTSANEPKLSNWIWWRSSLYHYLYQSSLIAPIEKIAYNSLSFTY